MTLDNWDLNPYHVNMDDFDHFDPWPTNWVEIAAFLNDIIDARIAEAQKGMSEDELTSHETELKLDRIVEKIWEQFCAGEIAGCPEIVPEAKQISLDNGRHYMNAAEAIAELRSRSEEYGVPFSKLWQQIADMMDDEIRETVHAELAPCTEEEFLARYLELAKEDLIIG